MFVFAADLFKEQYVGGAELTFGALLEATPVPVQKINCSQVTVQILKQNQDKFWIFGNYAQLSDPCKLFVIKNINYCVVEFDYKYCKYRTEHLHQLKDGSCDCPTTHFGKLGALFLAKSKINFWMSEGQLQAWAERFPALLRGNNHILSSIFTHETLDKLGSFDTGDKDDKWVILGSGSWIKGKEDAIKYAEENNLEYEVLWGLDYEQFLGKLASSKGLIHLPRGYDTCPRMVIEAKLLGCELVINENVQHCTEQWWNQDSDGLVDYLKSRTSFFWENLALVEETGLPTPCFDGEQETHFSIIIPSWNCEKWTASTLCSVLEQKYDNYTVYFVDDASDDSTWDVAKRTVGRYSNEVRAKLTLVRNKENKKALHNICNTIKQTKKDTVIVLLDGDDRFSNKHVLQHLNNLYSEEDVWVTTGSYVETGTARTVKSQQIPEEAWTTGIRKYREPPGHPNILSHLRTFRKSLYDLIRDEDLRDDDGEYYRCTFDRALMYPMVEMAGPEHHLAVDKVMYIYNTQNPRSVHHVDRKNQLRIEQKLRDQQPYERR